MDKGLIYNVITQFLGICGMALNIISYQSKSAKRIMLLQLFGSVFFVANYAMLVSPMGIFMNILGIARAIFYIKCKNPPKYSVAVFVSVSAVFYALSFTVFGKAPTAENLIFEGLTVIAFLALSVGFCSNNDKTVRITGLINSPLWLIYNIHAFTIGGILCEAFSIVSIIIGIIRMKGRKDNE